MCQTIIRSTLIVLILKLLLVNFLYGQSVKTEQKIRFENWTDNTNYVVLSVSPSLNSQLSFELPATAGTDGQFLSTNGNGILSWSTPQALPNLTAGSMVFSSGGNSFNEDNSNFFWDNTNKRLGIGTNTPAAVLDVEGDFKLGSGSFTLNTILKKDTTLTVTGIGNTGNTFKSIVVYVPGAKPNGNVIVNPRSPIHSASYNAFIAYSYVSDYDKVTLVFAAVSATNNSFSSKTFDIMVIQ